MWVADMEFAVAPEIARRKGPGRQENFRLYHGLRSGVLSGHGSMVQRKVRLEFPQRAALLFAGIVPALFRLTGPFGQRGRKSFDCYAILRSVRGATKFNHCGLVCSSLKYDGGRFTIDFADFAEKAQIRRSSWFIWCNPHNPSGRVWSEEELKQVAAIVEDNDLWIISDEDSIAISFVRV